MNTTYKQELISAQTELIESIARLLRAVPVDVEKMNYKPHEKSMVLHELIKHLQQVELYFIRGAVTGEWETENIPWHVGKHDPMVDQLKANHREAMAILEGVSEEDLLAKQVKLSYMEGSLMKILYHHLDHMSHHRTQLFYYLKLLEAPVDSRTIWGDQYPV